MYVAVAHPVAYAANAETAMRTTLSSVHLIGHFLCPWD